ncbi:MAG: STAS domain-containing protein [Acidimicrobiales bacterium]
MDERSTGGSGGGAVRPPLLEVVRHDAEVTRVRLRGEVDLAVADDLAAALIGLDGAAMEVDLSQLDFIDAAGIGAIVRVNNHLRDAGHHFVLTGARGPVRRVFELVDLGGLLVEAA